MPRAKRTVMQDAVRNELRRIGELLDSGEYPVVRNGGVVVPREPIVSPQSLGQESKHVGPGKEAAKARPGSRESERQGASSPRAPWPPSGPGTPRPATSLVVSELRNKFAHELATLEQAYPRTRHWLDDEGMWFGSSCRVRSCRGFHRMQSSSSPFGLPTA